ncbi:class F sortase [Streptomyces sp. NPDC028635]|uniref:class F sortase n=1 Tax=Streptomyces sp. NPDC028635 TaxID=3154800 RepID=UPI0033EBDFBB
MSPLTRRTFAGAAAATLLTACAAPKPHPATPEDTSTPPPGTPVPVRLLVPAIDVDTPVIELGLADDGTVEVPPVTAHDRAGWYRHSPVPGRTGPAVLLGHVTVGRYGDGVFRHLSRLRRGDRVTARLTDGTRPAFTVTAVRTVSKSRFPTADVYGDVGRPVLRLITCGGRRTDDGYPDNVIVFAESAHGGS